MRSPGSELNAQGKAIVHATTGTMNEVFDSTLKEIAKHDKHFKKDQYKFAAHMAWHAVKLTSAGARLALSGGADIHAWISLVKTAKAIYKAVDKYEQSAELVEKEIIPMLEKLRNEAQKAEEAGKTEKGFMEIKTVRDALTLLDTKIKAYDIKITGMDLNSRKLSKEALRVYQSRRDVKTENGAGEGETQKSGSEDSQLDQGDRSGTDIRRKPQDE